MDFEHILPSNLFNLFQSKHKYIYMDVLIVLYNRYDKDFIFGIPREEGKDLIVDYLAKNRVFINDFKDEEDKYLLTFNDVANYIIRRLIDTKWIKIDTNQNYDELINFPDYSSSLVLSLIEIKNSADNSLFSSINFSKEEKTFKGYLLTIYSLLNANTKDYGLIMSQVYKYTRKFLREIRKVDNKLNEFITLIDTKDSIKDLISLLMNYKEEVMDKAYFKLKTFDNVNKYKTSIIIKLETILEDKDIMNSIVNEYIFLNSYEPSYARFVATKHINDCIDIFNSIDTLMNEIDKKNRDYISSTLSKIKYFLNDSLDITGMLNSIMQFIQVREKNNKFDEAYDAIKGIFNFDRSKSISSSSLLPARMVYTKNENNILDKPIIDFSNFKEEFINSYKVSFNEDEIKHLLDKTIVEKEKEYILNNYVNKNMTSKDILKIIYLLIYISSYDEYQVVVKDEYIETKEFYFRNFSIIRRDK